MTTNNKSIAPANPVDPKTPEYDCFPIVEKTVCIKVQCVRCVVCQKVIYHLPSEMILHRDPFTMNKDNTEPMYVLQNRIPVNQLKHMATTMGWRPVTGFDTGDNRMMTCKECDVTMVETQRLVTAAREIEQAKED